jgi:hypothetical protein
VTHGKLTYLGHPAFLIATTAGDILIDPFLSGNPSTSIGPDDVHPDYILVTHGHSSHVGDTIAIARRTGATGIGPAELVTHLAGKGVANVHPMHIGAITFSHSVNSSSPGHYMVPQWRRMATSSTWGISAGLSSRPESGPSTMPVTQACFSTWSSSADCTHWTPHFSPLAAVYDGDRRRRGGYQDACSTHRDPDVLWGLPGHRRRPTTVPKEGGVRDKRSLRSPGTRTDVLSQLAPGTRIHPRALTAGVRPVDSVP